MSSEYKLTLLPKAFHNAYPEAEAILKEAKAQEGRNKELQTPQATGEPHADVSHR